MKIRWNGHSSFTIETGGRKIVTDPYEPGAFGGGIAYGPIETDGVSLVSVSHEHADHNHTAPFKNATIVKDSAAYGDINFIAIKTKHDERGGAARGDNRIFIIEAEGMRLCHLGDLGHILTEDLLKQIGKVDILMLPVGGFFTIDADAATRIYNAIDAPITIPMHYKTSKCGFDIAPVSEFLEKKSHVKKLDADEFEIAKDQLPSEPEIIILKHHN